MDITDDVNLVDFALSWTRHLAGRRRLREPRGLRTALEAPPVLVTPGDHGSVTSPKCRAVAQRLHFGVHLGRSFLIVFDDSFEEIVKKSLPKVVQTF